MIVEACSVFVFVFDKGIGERKLSTLRLMMSGVSMSSCCVSLGFLLTSYKYFACLDSVTFYAAGKQMRKLPYWRREVTRYSCFVVRAPVSFLKRCVVQVWWCALRDYENRRRCCQRLLSVCLVLRLWRCSFVLKFYSVLRRSELVLVGDRRDA